MAKLTPLTDNKVIAIKKPDFTITVPEELTGKFTRDEWKVFGHLCNLNPTLDRLSEPTFLKNVAKCIDATSNGKFGDFTSDPLKMTSHPLYLKWSAYYQKIKDDKKAYNKEHPEEVEARTLKNKELNAKYGFAIQGNKKEPLQSYTLEPEGLFPGRPGAPDMGLWKEATDLSQVIVNTNHPNELPVLIENGVEVKYDWKHKWNPEHHYAAVYPVVVGVPGEKPFSVTRKKIMFGAKSSIKKEGQKLKYQAGEQLMDKVDDIMNAIEDSLKKEPDSIAVACYMLFKKGIRIGAKKETKNGTKGLLTLTWGKEVTREGGVIHFNFIGKDSVTDISDVDCGIELAKAIEKAWKACGKLKCTKTEIKDFVKKIAPEIPYTPKLTRTVVAANTMKDALKEVIKKYKLTKDSPVALKKLAFNEANMEVAHKLNHQKGVNKTAEAKRALKFEESKKKMVEREKKALQTKAKREAQIAKLTESKKEGWQDKVKDIQAKMDKASMNLDISKKNNEFKEANQNFVSTTSKSAYIDPKIVKSFCEEVDLPIESVYTSSLVDQFTDLM